MGQQKGQGQERGHSDGSAVRLCEATGEGGVGSEFEISEVDGFM